MSGIKIISKNKKAFHDYNIEDRFEAGLQLVGTEVKALRNGQVNLQESWVDITTDNQALLNEAFIGKYSHGNQLNHEERRQRLLLLHKKEIIKLANKINAKGMSLVPLKIYFKGQNIKVELGLGKGKKNYDKRESEKKKTADRAMARALK